MRVGLVTQWYDPEPGPAAVPGVLARGLRDAGHDVKVLTGHPNYPTGRIYEGYKQRWRTRETDLGIEVLRIPVFPSHGASAHGRLANYGSFAAAASTATGFLADVDGIWVYNSPPTVSAPAWLAHARAKAPTLLHIMDLWPDSVYAAGFLASSRQDSQLDRLLQMLISGTYKVADTVAYISPGVRDVLMHRGVPAEKLAYIPLWADEALFSPRPPDERLAAELGVADRTVVMYAGAIGEAQGLDTLVHAAQRLQDLSDVVVLVAGTGTAEARLRALADEMRLPNVTFLGARPKEEMPRLLSVGHLHVVSLAPSPLADISTPSKIQTTLAIGRPMVVAATGDAALVAESSGAGWVAAPGDAEGLARVIAEAVAPGVDGLLERGRLARIHYEREFAVSSGVERVAAALSSTPHGAEMQPGRRYRDSSCLRLPKQ